MRLTAERTSELVTSAAQGDQHAWEQLVDSYAGLIWAITRNHRLGFGDASDVSQTTWLRLVESIDKIEDPSRVGAWLATTARRECLRVLGRTRKQVLVPETDAVLNGPAVDAPELDAALLADERAADVQQALEQLPARCQELLRLLMLDPPPSYEEISAAMSMPIGSIGPTRGRCLRRLRGLLQETGIAETPSSIFDGDDR